MSGGLWGLVVAVVLGLVISEFSELAPWLAQKLIRWAARVRYPTRVEELSALIAERPGKLFKLVSASRFACVALTYRITHRKTVPVRSVSSRFWIGLCSALVAWVLLTGERMLMVAIVTNYTSDYDLPTSVWSPSSPLIIWASIAAFATAAELLVPSRLPTGWAAAAVSFALALIIRVVLDSWPWSDVWSLLFCGEMAMAAGVSAACAIWLGNRFRFPVVAASSAILGGCPLTVVMIFESKSTSPYVVNLVEGLGYGIALGFSAGLGVLLGRVLCGRLLSQPSST